MKPIVDILYNMVYYGFEYFGRYYSSYRGFVVDRDDPKQLGRLRVVVPGIIDTATSYWSPGKGAFAGKEYGLHIIPPVDTLIWVTFENGDPNKPVWEHGYFGNEDIQEDPLMSVDNYWLQTPKGNRLELNDEYGLIRLKLGDDQVIEINGNGISIVTGKIYLGSLDDADEPAVLGDTLEKRLVAMIRNTLRLHDELRSVSSKLSSAVDNLTLGVAPNPSIAQLLIQMKSEGLKAVAAHETFDGSVNGLSQALADIGKKIPEIKSQKVKLDR